MALPGAGRLSCGPAATAGRASATQRSPRSRFTADGTTIATATRGSAGLYAATWNPRGLAVGEHDLGATVTDAGGQTALQTVSVKICKK
jgi:hypothetical protein